MTAERQGPLSRFKVIDLTRARAGPTAARCEAIGSTWIFAAPDHQIRRLFHYFIFGETDDSRFGLIGSEAIMVI